MPIRLFANVADPDGDSLTVTFYGRPVTAAARPDFTLIEIPDTQNYCASLAGATPAGFLAQTNWIVASRVNHNIAYVLHVGDIVQNCNEVPMEWTIADFCMKPLEDPVKTLRPEGIPYGAVPGNHDIKLLRKHKPPVPILDDCLVADGEDDAGADHEGLCAEVQRLAAGALPSTAPGCVQSGDRECDKHQ